MAEFLKAKTSTFVNKPMGVIDTRTGGADVGNALANLGNQISQMAFEEAVVDQEQAGKDYVASLQTRNDKGELQYVELPKSLSKVATRAATPQLRKRYANELQLDTSRKLTQLHTENKDNPVEFDRKANLYITETINTLKENGYGEVTGQFATDASGLMVQHSNKLKMDAYKKQEEVANEKLRVITSNNLNESYQLRVNGKSNEADKLDQVSINNYKELISNDAINAPYYQEQISKIKTNNRQAVMEVEFRKLNAAQMAAYNRSLTLGVIDDEDKGLLSGYTDKHFQDQRKDLNPTEIRLLTSWASTTKGKFADAHKASAKVIAFKNAQFNWTNGRANTGSKSESDNIDGAIGMSLGIGRKVNSIDMLSLSPERLTNVNTNQKINATVASSFKNIVNNPAVVATHIANLEEQDNNDAAERAANNYVNIASVVSGKLGIQKEKTAKAIQVKQLMRDGKMSAVDAFKAVHVPPEDAKAIAMDVRDKVIANDSSITEDNYKQSAYIKNQVKKIGLEYELDTKETNTLNIIYLNALRAKGATPESAKEVVEEFIEEVYKEDETSFNPFERTTGTRDTGSVSAYYINEDEREKVISIWQTTVDQDINQYTKEDRLVIGDNVFLMADQGNGSTGYGRWTLVDADGLPIKDDFGVITFDTDQITQQLQEEIENERKENEAEATLSKGWWQDIGSDFIGWYTGQKGSGLIRMKDGPQSLIPGQDMTTDLEIANREQTSVDVVESVVPKSDLVTATQNVASDVSGFVSDTGEKFVRNLEIVSEKSVELQNKIYDLFKKEGSEVLRSSPEFIQLTSLLGPDPIDTIVNSVKAMRPIDAHVTAVEQLIEDEGFSSIQYPDGAGNSVGYGFAITSLEPDERALLPDINKVTKPQAKAVLNLKVKKITDKYRRDVPDWDTLSAKRQAALINFAFQLGYENVTAQGPDPTRQWPMFFDLLKRATKEPSGSDSRNEMFARVRNNMLYNYSPQGRTYTTWFNQTPDRAKLVAQKVRGY